MASAHMPTATAEFCGPAAIRELAAEASWGGGATGVVAQLGVQRVMVAQLLGIVREKLARISWNVRRSDALGGANGKGGRRYDPYTCRLAVVIAHQRNSPGSE